MLNHFSHVQLFEILWTVTHQVPLSLGFFRQEYWSRAMPSSRKSSQRRVQGSNPHLFMSPALACWFFTTNATWKPGMIVRYFIYKCKKTIVTQQCECT